MKKFILLFFSILFVTTLTVWAQSATDYNDIDLDELLSLDAVNVGARKPLSNKEVPGNVTIFSSQEIQALGARNLIDVLRLVPGIDFGYDVGSVVGLGVRGNWASEGKTLLLFNGIPMNENSYGTLGSVIYLPVNHIHKIEVTRGPGASYYGGFAALAVINVITKGAAGSAEKAVDISSGTTSEGWMRVNGGGYTSFATQKGRFYGGIHASDSKIGNGIFEDSYGVTFPLYKNNELLTTNAYAGGSINNFSFDVITKFDRLRFRDGYEDYGGKVNSHYNWLQTQLRYKLDLNSKWSLLPKLTIQLQKPWAVDSTDQDFEAYHYIVNSRRYTANITVHGEILSNWSTQTGVEYYFDQATIDDPYYTDESAYNETVIYHNMAVFTQHTIRSSFAILNAGLRYDYNSSYRSNLVPWVGLSKQINKFSIKGLFGQTFRAPSVENIRYAYDIDLKPERTRLFEFDFGYQWSDNFYSNITFFDAKIFDVIVYAEEGLYSNYKNYGDNGTRGFETEVRYSVPSKGNFNLSYSFYIPAYKGVDVYESSSENAFLAFAPHKVNFFGSYYLTPSITVNPSITFYSTRYGYVYDADLAAQTNDEETTSLKSYDPLTLINLSVRAEDVLVSGLDITLGIFDGLNSHYAFIQPYYSYGSALNGPNREFLVKLMYRF